MLHAASVRHGIRALSSLAVFTSAALAIGTACAQTYPVKPVRIVAASSPGSGVDIVARIVAQGLSERLGQQAIVENRAGAGGNLGAESVARAPADGYTLFVATPAHTINSSMQSNLKYDVIRSFAPITLLTTGHYMLVVHPTVPVKSVKELIALTRAQPGKLNYASAGEGNATHLAGELFNQMAGVKTTHIPYKGGGAARVDLLGGQVDMMFHNITAVLQDVRQGKLRGLAVTGPRRAEAAPELPTMSESGLTGYDITSWFGLMAPAGTPADVIARLQRDSAQALQQPDVKQRLATLGSEAVGSTPQQLTSLMQNEIAKWGKLIKSAGLRIQ